MQLDCRYRLGDVPSPLHFKGFLGRVNWRGPRPRSRPRCRAAIIRDRLCPAAVVDTSDGLRARGLAEDEVWKGHWAAFAQADGSVPLQQPVHVSPGIRKEMVLMLREQSEGVR